MLHQLIHKINAMSAAETVAMKFVNNIRGLYAHRRIVTMICHMMEAALNEGKGITMMGDFNCNIYRRGPNLPLHGRLETELNLRQLITQPTRITDSSE